MARMHVTIAVKERGKDTCEALPRTPLTQVGINVSIFILLAIVMLQIFS